MSAVCARKAKMKSYWHKFKSILSKYTNATQFAEAMMCITVASSASRDQPVASALCHQFSCTCCQPQAHPSAHAANICSARHAACARCVQLRCWPPSLTVLCAAARSAAQSVSHRLGVLPCRLPREGRSPGVLQVGRMLTEHAPLLVLPIAGRHQGRQDVWMHKSANHC